MSNPRPETPAPLASQLLAFVALARMAFFRETFYRFEVLFNALKAVVFVLVIASVWRAVYATRQTVAGMTLDEVIVYTCVAITIALVYEVNLEREIGERLRDGNIALHLIKPINFFFLGFAQGWGTLAYTAIFSAAPTFITLLLFFDLHLAPMNPGVSLVTFVLGFSLFFAFCHLTALTTFFTIDTWGVEYLRQTIVRFLAGGFLPLAFFPDALHRVAMWSPFPYMIYAPARALTGQLPREMFLETMAMQVAWCILLGLLNYLYWKLIVRQVAIHGG
jgi:ABC-2 type transport system permease protein